MLHRKIILLLVIIVITGLFAEEQVNLEELINKALDRSLSIESELMQYKNQLSSKRVSLYNWLPSANVNIGRNWTDEEWQDTSAGFNASWSVSSNDSRFFEMRRQMIAMLSADLSLEDVKKNIAYSVMNLYLDVLQAEDMVKLQQELLAVEVQKYENNQLRFELGETSLLDMQQAEIDKIQAEISFNNLLLSLENKRSELFYYIGIKDEGAQLVPVELKAVTAVAEYQPNLQYQIQKKGIKSQKLLLNQSLLDMFPWLALSWNYSRNSVNQITDFDEYSEFSQISLQFSYSIFNVFDSYENYHTVKRQYLLAQRRLADQERSDRRKLANLNKTFDNQQKNLELYNRKAELASVNLERAQLEYAQGAISILDLNDYQNRYYTARQNLILEQYRVLETQESINLLLSKPLLGKW